MMISRDELEYASTATLYYPKQPFCFVQSPPPSDSNEDGDKSSSSMQSTPVYSPTHSSRTSSSSRISSNWRSLKGYMRKSGKVRQEFAKIEEDIDYYHMNEGCSRVWQCFMAIMGFGAFFSFFCLIMWGASRPYQPQISMKAFKVHSFYYGQGADRTGVPTKLLTVNCSVTMDIQNPATFFGIHVSSKPVKLIFSEITVATGQLDEYYQPRKSQRSMSVNLDGRRVPLYGAGVAFVESDGSDRVPLKLDFEFLSKGYLVGKLVKAKHRKHVSCSLLISSRSTEEVIFKQDSCVFE